MNPLQRMNIPPRPRKTDEEGAAFLAATCLSFSAGRPRAAAGGSLWVPWAEPYDDSGATQKLHSNVLPHLNPTGQVLPGKLEFPPSHSQDSRARATLVRMEPQTFDSTRNLLGNPSTEVGVDLGFLQVEVQRHQKYKTANS